MPDSLVCWRACLNWGHVHSAYKLDANATTLQSWVSSGLGVQVRTLPRTLSQNTAALRSAVLDTRGQILDHQGLYYRT
jgi:hypothetical protein